jgi:hypothetical protein
MFFIVKNTYHCFSEKIDGGVIEPEQLEYAMEEMNEIKRNLSEEGEGFLGGFVNPGISTTCLGVLTEGR